MPKRKDKSAEPDEKTKRLLDQPLPSAAEFTGALQKVLSVTKEESDRQLAEYRAASRARRQKKA